ncbi:MAG: mismatch-specific DNA-glycosylase [Propionicimonas sp.]
MLPPLVRDRLQVIFCGTAVATASAERGHYYSGRGNRFWQLLHESGFTPVQLKPEQDVRLLDYGIGITDLVRHVAQSHDRGLDYGAAASVAASLVGAAPAWIAFNGLTAGRAAATRLRLAQRKAVGLGEQAWEIGASRVFVVPNSSAANAGMPYSLKLEWWTRFHDLVGSVEGSQPDA